MFGLGTSSTWKLITFKYKRHALEESNEDYASKKIGQIFEILFSGNSDGVRITDSRTTSHHQVQVLGEGHRTDPVEGK